MLSDKRQNSRSKVDGASIAARSLERYFEAGERGDIQPLDREEIAELLGTDDSDPFLALSLKTSEAVKLDYKTVNEGEPTPKMVTDGPMGSEMVEAVKMLREQLLAAPIQTESVAKRLKLYIEDLKQSKPEVTKEAYWSFPNGTSRSLVPTS